MIDGIFVFDNVVHMFNASEQQILDPWGRNAQEHWLAMNDQNRPDGDNQRYGGRPDRYAFAENWTVEKAGKMIFEDSDTDMAMAQTVTLFDFWKDGLSSVETQYELYKAFPDHVLFCGGVDPGYQTLEHCLERTQFQIQQWGAVSMKFYNAHMDGRTWRCDDRKLAYPIYEKAMELGVNLLQFHKGVPIGPAKVEDSMPNDLQGVARDFPEANIVIHHLSMPYFEETVSIAARFPNVYLALSGNLHQLLFAPRAVQEFLGRLLRDVGAHKLLWGSEAPIIGCPQPVLKLFMALQIPQDLQNGYGYPQITHQDKELILGQNMARLMGTDIEERKTQLGLTRSQPGKVQ